MIFPNPKIWGHQYACKSLRPEYRNLYTPENDGTTHYNILTHSSIKTSRILSIGLNLPIYYDNEFNSTIYSYLNNKYRLKQIAFNYTNTIPEELFTKISYVEFQKVIPEITKDVENILRIKFNIRAFRNELICSEFPFVSYYVQNGYVERNTRMSWYIDLLNKLKSEYRETKEKPKWTSYSKYLDSVSAESKINIHVTY